MLICSILTGNMPRDIFMSTLKLFDGAQPSVCEGANVAT